MLTREECLKFAEECETMARIARHEENRERLQSMALAWRKLADASETKKAH